MFYDSHDVRKRERENFEPFCLPAMRILFSRRSDVGFSNVITVATHPDDKLGEFATPVPATPTCCADGKPKQNRRGINMRTPWPIDSAHHTPSDLFITRNFFFARLRTSARVEKARATIVRVADNSREVSVGILRWKTITCLRIRYSN